MTEPADVARGPRNRGPKNRGDDVVDEARGLVLAALLAALAGTVDAIGYLHLSGLFISFMSGNSTQLAAALGQGDLAEAGTIAELIALFVLGAAAGQVLAGFTGKRHMTWVLVGVAVLLAIAAMLATAPEPMVLAMGVLNAAMRRAGRVPVSLTFVTGMLVRFGQGLGDFLTGRFTGWNWLVQATPWVGLIAGATIGSAVYMHIGEAAIWVPVALAGLLAAGSVAVPQPD
jgi:uncharacterized membrane protein YoaK (UPF0700 family)